MPAREQRLAMLDAELLEAVSVAEIRNRMAVVETHLGLVAGGAHGDTDVAEKVELRSYLPDLGGHELVVINQAVLAERPAGWTAGDAQREDALAEQRHRGFIVVPQLVDLAVLDPLRGLKHFRGRDVVRRAGLVLGAPFGRPPFFGAELGRRDRIGRRRRDRRQREFAVACTGDSAEPCTFQKCAAIGGLRCVRRR